MLVKWGIHPLVNIQANIYVCKHVKCRLNNLEVEVVYKILFGNACLQIYQKILMEI